MPRALRFAVILLPLMLSACVTGADKLSDISLPLSAEECGLTTRTGRNCQFRNAPLELEAKPVTLPGRPYTFYPTAKALDFVDGKAHDWNAPKQTLTDGASIPRVFVPVIGDPRTPEFALAAAMHDAYCGIGNESGPAYHSATWQEVHRMFYDTLVAGGTGETRAKVMFAAVWLGGPRWYPHSGAADTRLDGVPDTDKRAALKATMAYIESDAPSLDDLVGFMGGLESAMVQSANRSGRDVPPVPSPNNGGGNGGGGNGGGSGGSGGSGGGGQNQNGEGGEPSTPPGKGGASGNS